MKNDTESFTPEQQAQLEPYVTNTDRSVFLLTNLPEVIKGALFSRYSRSTLGLRSLLLKEFILGDESEFRSIQGEPEEKGSRRRTELAIERARKFYDRILDGYGDDSIGELGGAHLALENLSILATKTVEDARIGGSPLEKSTRYVGFSDKVNGRFRYFRDAKLMESEHRQLYLETCDHLFETYDRITEPVRDHVRRLMPREPAVSEEAYERSVRAMGYDLIRGLLPASTQTNMGVFGNGRFFETLIRKLRLEPLQELKDLGQTSFEELSKVIPSFIRRADPEHQHFQDYQDYTLAQRELARDFAESNLKTPIPVNQRTEVRLAEHDPDAENKLLSALLFPHTHASLNEIRGQVRGWTEEKKQRLLEQTFNLRKHRRHKPGRGLELPFYTFDLLGDYGIYRDLQRHRMLTQERQLLTTRFGYEKPVELDDAGVGEIFDSAMQQAAVAFEKIQTEFPAEAQYVVPMGYRIRWFAHINLRALSWLVELRSIPQGHPGYRHIAQQMFLRVREVHPLLAKFMNYVDLEEYSLGRLDAEVRQESSVP